MEATEELTAVIHEVLCTNSITQINKMHGNGNDRI